MNSSNREYDLVVIGSGPGGQRAAIQALKLGKRVAIVDANPMVGGNCLHDGTIPSKSFREAIFYLSGWRQRSHYGKAYRVKERVEMLDLTERTSAIERDLEQTTRSQIQRNKGKIITGFASFVDPHRILVKNKATDQILVTEKVVIATGTRPRHPEGFEFDGKIILDSDQILRLDKIPNSLTVVGGGVIGCEYGSMFSALGVKVNILEQNDRILGFVDEELVDTLVHTLRQHKAAIVTGDKVLACTTSPDGRAVTYMESGRRIVSDRLLVSAGRVPNVEGLNIEKLGIEQGKRGHIEVNKHYQTNIESVYAVGDVIGFPGLASTALEQGRRAACHAFGINDQASELPLPYGIYAIPEIAMVGQTEKQLVDERIPYEFGIARFNELERGKIIGDDTGLLKLLFHRNTLEILGIHIIGEAATELIHVGQAVMSFKGGIDYFANTVFNYPTLGQAYKTAALDGINKVIATQDLPDEVPREDVELH